MADADRTANESENRRGKGKGVGDIENPGPSLRFGMATLTSYDFQDENGLELRAKS
jgi:hypothetical protein